MHARSVRTHASGQGRSFGFRGRGGDGHRAYGFPRSGSATAQAHWNAIPGSYKHAGDRSVPTGGLAFFSTGSDGHVMISIGRLENRWGAHHLGWAQPWFQHNH